MFEAWSTAEHLSQWWGPDGFTLTSHSLDFSDGGFWTFTMHGPDGRDYKNKIQFIEIKPPAAISYKHAGDQEDTEHVRFQTKIKFTEIKGGTRIDVEMEFPTSAELEHVAKHFGAIEGAEQHLRSLGDFVESLKEKRK